jgi:hypothetical protein
MCFFPLYITFLTQMVPGFGDGNFSHIIIPVTLRELQWTIFLLKGTNIEDNFRLVKLTDVTISC